MSDQLFKGLTRPTMKWGVTSEAAIVVMVLGGVVFIAWKSLLSLLVTPVLYAIAYYLCAKDPRIFRLFGLWLKTTSHSNKRRIYGAASASPFVSTRPRTLSGK
jgi:type IV secretion system protein VirB3